VSTISSHSSHLCLLFSYSSVSQLYSCIYYMRERGFQQKYMHISLNELLLNILQLSLNTKQFIIHLKEHMSKHYGSLFNQGNEIMSLMNYRKVQICHIKTILLISNNG